MRIRQKINVVVPIQESAAQNAETQATLEDTRAAKEKTMQAGLMQQKELAVNAVADLKKVLDSVGKPVAINIQSDIALAALHDITDKLAAIKDRTVTVTVKTVGLAAGTGVVVTDSVAEEIMRAAAEIGIAGIEAVSTGEAFDVEGEGLERSDLELLADILTLKKSE